MSTYTYVGQLGNKIVSRGFYNSANKFIIKEDYKPTLFTYSGNETSEWQDLFNNTIYPIQPGNIKDCRDLIQQYKDVSGFTILGNTSWYIQYIADNFPGEMKVDMNSTRVHYIDIETTVGDSFPNVDNPQEEILLISLYDNIEDMNFLYTSTDVTLDNELLLSRKCDPDKVEVKYYHDESEMLRNFIMDWSFNYPDIVTGWNSELFDIPYIISRCNRVIGENVTKKLSPFGFIKDKQMKVGMGNKEVTSYEIIGVNSLDYMKLMKLFTYGVRDSWKLDIIAEQELGLKKLEFDGTFRSFYENDFNLFATYNVIDTHLVKLMNDKLKLVELALTLTYDAKVNPGDVFSQLKLWDSIIYNYLLNKKIIYPNKIHQSRANYEGAYVKKPLVGKHKWIMSYDLASLYPHLIMQYNMSPETISNTHIPVNVDDLLVQKYDTSELIEKNIALSANGTCYDKDKHGFMPEIINKIYNERAKTKKKMIQMEKDYEATHDESLLPKIGELHNRQMSLKIQINSLYGAMGSNFFRFYDLRMAEGITLSGQLSIRWIHNDVNKLLNKLMKNANDKDYIAYIDTDSVVGDTLLRVDGKSKSIEDLYNEETEYMKKDDTNRQYVKCVNGKKSLSMNMYTGDIEEKRIRYVMKHRVNKRMFRISVNNTSVTVTEDHSIIVKRNDKYLSVKPSDILENDKIIHIPTPKF